MSIWTVMFGDDPLATHRENIRITTRVKIFSSRRKAYDFRDFCKRHGLYADVVHHSYHTVEATFH